MVCVLSHRTCNSTLVTNILPFVCSVLRTYKISLTTMCGFVTGAAGTTRGDRYGHSPSLFEA
eukprot:4705111-Amphidinium_carterae.1